MTEEELSHAPAEAQQDVLQELDRIERASSLAGESAIQDAEPDVSQPMDPLSFDPSRGMSSPVQEREGLPSFGPAYELPDRSSRHAETLEDLYQHFPKLRTGEWCLRVERNKPSRFRGKPCDGWLEDVWEVMDLPAFKARFGGGTYTVSVLGESSTNMHADGTMAKRTMSRLRLEISGEPKFLGESEDDMSARYTALHAGPGNHHTVERAKLQLDHQERVRQDERADHHAKILQRAEREKWEEISRAQTERMSALREAHQESSAVLRAQNDRLSKQLADKDSAFEAMREKKEAEVARLKDELLKARQEYIFAAQKEETERIRELKERHATELQRYERETAQKLEALARDHREQLKDAYDRHERERKEQAERYDRERQMSETEHRRQIDSMSAEHSRQVEHLERMYKGRLDDAQRQAEREIATLQTSFQAQIQSIRDSERSQATAATTSAENHVSLLQMQLEQLQAENRAQSESLEQLRQQLYSSNKDAVTQITEAKQLLDTIGIGQPKEEPEDWKKAALGIARSLTDKLPEAVRSVAEARAQNQQRVEMMQRHEQAQARAAQLRRDAALGHRQQLSPRPLPAAGQAPAAMSSPRGGAHRAPPPGMVFDPDEAPGGFDPDGAPPMAAGAFPRAATQAPAPPYPRATQAPAPPPPPRPPARAEITAPPPRAAAPQEGSEHSTTPSSSSAPMEENALRRPPPDMTDAEVKQEVQWPGDEGASQEQKGEQPSSEQQTSETGSGGPEGEATQSPTVTIDQEKVLEFVQSLDQAIRAEVVGPQTFAREFLKAAGAETTRALVQSLTAEQFVESVEQSGMKTVITTRDGRKFIAEAWEEARRLLSEQ